MRHILACVVTGLVLASANLTPTPALAQQQQGDQPQSGAELVRLWERIPQIEDPAQRIAESERALKLLGEVDSWPLPVARDQARARLWRWVGLGHAQLTSGEREENLERAIAAYERATELFARQSAPEEVARTQSGLAEVLVERIRGDRAENIEKAIALHEAALAVLTREAFAGDWTFTQISLAQAYLLRIRGDRAENLHAAMARYEAVLAVITREALPEDWALAQMGLGAAHLLNYQGDRTESIDKAITAFEAALTAPIRTALPKQWADAQMNLGVAYSDRIRGDRPENQEKAIAAFEAALTVRTREATPQDWATTQHYLANILAVRLRGNPTENQEKAIALYEAALTVRTREAAPHDWALTRNALANAYRGRALGDRGENVERAIGYLQEVLAVRRPAEQPKEWADTKYDLGVAYLLRARGERADNLETAIGAFEEALSVLSRKQDAAAWALAKSRLALVLTYRIHGQPDENREMAIQYLQDALDVLPREAHPQAWAEAQLGLGVAYNRRNGGQGADRDRAIRHFEAALTVMTREADPRAWAAATIALGHARLQQRAGADPATAVDSYEAALAVFSREDAPLEWSLAQSLLGEAYFESKTGDRAAAVSKAIGHLEAAAGVQRQRSPRDSFRTLRALGAALSEQGAWQRAGAAYASARETFLQLLAQGLDDTAAAALIEDAGPLFAEAAYAATQLGELDKALELANEGRARLMAVTLKLQTLDLPPEKRQRLEAVRGEIRVAERTLEAPATQGAERAAAVERMVSLRQELASLVNDADAAKAQGRGSALVQARALASKGGAVAVPIVTKLGGKVLVVGTGLTSVDLPEITPAALHTLLFGTGAEDGWIRGYAVNLLPDDEMRSEAWPIWMAAIEGLGPELWRRIGVRLDAGLKRAGVKAGGRLVWLPTGALGILPLGIAQNPATKRRLLDDYEIVYAPSLDALAAAKERIAAAPPATLAAVVNPTGDLPAAEQEGRAVASYFPAGARAVLEGAAATPEAVLAALRGRSYWHFASHGSFEWKEPRRSALLMHGHKPLSVGRLLESGGLGAPRLVVLSACETGLYDTFRNADEFVGLPGTFTALGAAGVLGTLWPVNDMATALLLAKFYDLHLVSRLAPPTALRRAQLWLRQASSAELVAYARGAARQGRLDARHVAAIREELSADGLRRARSRPRVESTKAPAGADRPSARAGRDRPYAHPFYWAGFIHTGL
jgi:CHAT domain-containing protein/tetratricopeptide (TPR) repeat protein